MIVTAVILCFSLSPTLSQKCTNALARAHTHKEVGMGEKRKAHNPTSSLVACESINAVDAVKVKSRGHPAAIESGSDSRQKNRQTENRAR